MCHFVTATLSPGADREAAAAVADRFGRAWEPLENRHVIEQLPRGDQYFLTTRGHCDCGTALGSAVSRHAEAPLDRQIEKLKRKGWGQAKIDRWLADKTNVRSRREAPERRSDSWEDLIPAVLNEARAKHVGLLLHWYSGDIESERIHILRQERVPISKITAELLSTIEEDVLYQFADGAA